MQDEIGATAGKIWDVLKSKERVTISQLPKLVKEKDSLTYQGLGWLAREGKVDYATQGNKTFVFLAHEEVNK